MAKATTAPWVGNLSGRVGNIVLVESPYGTLVRTLPERSCTKSPLQQASEDRVAAASRAFGALTREEGQAWAAYGKTLAEPHPKTGRLVGLSGQQAHNRLANKMLQIDPHAVLPKAPPTAPFFGDGVRIAATPLPLGRGRGGVESLPQQTDQAEHESTPTLPSPKGEAPGVTFNASSANAPGVLTELLLQPLASQHRRTYLERYRTQAFVAFTGTARTVTIPCPKGWYAAAVRFVEAATGRTTTLVEIGVVLAA